MATSALKLYIDRTLLVNWKVHFSVRQASFVNKSFIFSRIFTRYRCFTMCIFLAFCTEALYLKHLGHASSYAFLLIKFVLPFCFAVFQVCKLLSDIFFHVLVVTCSIELLHVFSNAIIAFWKRPSCSLFIKKSGR